MIELKDPQCASFLLGVGACSRSSMERDETMDSIVSVSSGMSGMVRDDIQLRREISNLEPATIYFKLLAFH